jgi:hypothetical protein
MALCNRQFIWYRLNQYVDFYAIVYDHNLLYSYGLTFILYVNVLILEIYLRGDKMNTRPFGFLNIYDSYRRVIEFSIIAYCYFNGSITGQKQNQINFIYSPHLFNNSSY